MDAHEFGDALSTSLTPVALQARRGFSADYRESTNGRVQVSRIAATSHRSRGGSGPRSSPGAAVIWNYQVSGVARVEQDGITTSAAAGDFWRFRVDRPYALTFETDFELIGLAAPTTWFPASASVGTCRVDGSDPAVAAIGAVVERLERDLGVVSVGIRRRFIGHILDCVETIDRPGWTIETRESSASQALMSEAFDVIDAALASPDLTPRSIADTLHVSVRTLHGAFGTSGATVASTIRTRRLERCRNDLADSARDGLAVSDIGARWGLASPSHFAALFHATYGVTPTEFRRSSRILPPA